MSAKASQTDGVGLYSDEPVTHDYDLVGQCVLGACVVCGNESGCRLMRADYDREDVFKRRVNDDLVPTELWRRCPECHCYETHLVC